MLKLAYKHIKIVWNTEIRFIFAENLTQMKKREAVNHIISVVGFVPHPVIFEIYSDEDEIPQGLVDVECNYPASDMDFNLSLGWGIIRLLYENDTGFP